MTWFSFAIKFTDRQQVARDRECGIHFAATEGVARAFAVGVAHDDQVEAARSTS